MRNAPLFGLFLSYKTISYFYISLNRQNWCFLRLAMECTGISIYCRELPEDKADGAEKPECMPTFREGFRAPPNAVIGLRNK